MTHTSAPEVSTSASSDTADLKNTASSTNTVTMNKKETAREARYQCLLKLIDKALSQSRQSFDVSKAVQECYGEDASIFEDVAVAAQEGKDDGGAENGGHGNSNLLTNAIENMIDTVNDRVKEEIEQFLREHNVCENLTLVDSIIAQLDQQDAEQAQAEKEDRESALRAFEAVKLPKGVSPEDVLSYHKFELRRKERDALVDELAKVEAEIKKLEEQQAATESRTKESMLQMGKVEHELERSADACSLGVAATT